MTQIVYGGAFDPVHKEHIYAAMAAVKELKANRLILVPTYSPPHKADSEAMFNDRVAMLKLAFADFPIEVIIDDVEYGRNVNYAVENIPRLKLKYGDFYYLIGGDSLIHFDNWHQPDKIVKQTRIAVVGREGYSNVAQKTAELNRKWNSDIVILKAFGKNISSSKIKACLNFGEVLEEIPNAVMSYIINNNLYRKFLPMVNKVETYLNPDRFAHSKNVAIAALDINSANNLKLPFDKVFTAGILHDCGKYRCGSYIDGVPKDSIGTPIEHQFAGAAIAANDFGISDADILNSIRYHSTGRPKMSTLEKLIYVADMVSAERSYDVVDKIRNAAYNNFEEGFKLGLSLSVKWLTERKSFIYPLTMTAYNFYIKGAL